MPPETEAGQTAATRLLEVVTSCWMGQAAAAAAQLRLPDLLAAGPLTADELANATETHAPALRQLLRALTTIDLLRVNEDGAFENTAMGALLCEDAPDSVRSCVIYWAKYQLPLWPHLTDSVKTGQSANKLRTGRDGYPLLERFPNVATLFHDALAERTRTMAGHIVEAYNFPESATIIDVGGGCGDLLAAILEGNSTAQGILFDQPSVIEQARTRFKSTLADRCEFVEGDFFVSVPSGCDVYLLKSVMHNWDDVSCQTILQNCRRAMKKAARLVLVERLVPDRLATCPQHQDLARSDLNMLVALGTRERTEREFHDLLAAAGLHLSGITAAGPSHHVLEALNPTGRNE